MVVDADGLNNLALIKNWPAKRKASLVLTPHPGEIKRLWEGLFGDRMPADRSDQAARLAVETGTVVALKGANTVVTDGRRQYVNTTGNPGMATAGSGDALTGAIAAFMGQGLGEFDAAVLGVYSHGLAGDIAADRKGQTSMIATDIIDCLPDAIRRG
jgi:NAD(P)H-hydrate epimerase